MAENLIARSFTGGKSFMSNHYAIWWNGLGDHKQNWYAIQQGEKYMERMFYQRSVHGNASYGKFIDFLKKVENKEAKKERDLVMFEISKIEKIQPNSSRVASAKRAVEQGEFGTAYFFLQQTEEELERFVDNYQKMTGNKSGNISHSSLFWNSEFDTYFAKKLHKWLDEKSNNSFNKNLTLEQIVDEWIEEATVNSNGIVAQSLYDLKQSALDNLKNYFNKNNMVLSSSTKEFTKLSKAKIRKFLEENDYTKTKKGEKRDVKTSTKIFAKDVANAALKGFGQELSQTAKQGRQGLSFNTGKIKKEMEKVSGGTSKVQVKKDVVSYITDEVSIDVEQIKQSLAELARNNVQAAMDEVERQLKELQKEKPTRIFKVTTNVKGYRSRKDMQIEGEGSFQQRTQNLQKIAEHSKSLPAFSMDKIMFMLNNIMPGCLNEKRIHHVVDYLAAICVVWMWDDYTDLLDVDGDNDSIETVRMFSAGGMYYSASQILRQTRENLEKQVGTKSEQFVNIDIKTPTFDPHSVYKQLVDKYPIKNDMEYQERQATLAKRWDSMRNLIEKEGKIAIYFKQKELEDMISNLSGILGL